MKRILCNDSLKGGNQRADMSGLHVSRARRALACLALCAALLCTGPALAQGGFVLPTGLTALGAESFAGCAGLTEIIIPSSVTELGGDCFADCGEALLIHCEPGSAAHAYALEHGVDYDAETVCRALVISENYTGTGRELYGPSSDARAVRFCLETQRGRPFDVTHRSNLTAAEILSGAASAFAGATEQDISLFYFSGHGDSDGQLIGSDDAGVYPDELRAVLDAVPGRKIVIIDACYSGVWVPDSGFPASARFAQLDGAASFAEDFVNAFSGFRVARGVPGDYYVIAAARDTEKSREIPISSGGLTRVMGCFTYTLCLGCGWNGVTSRTVSPAADANGDGAVSLAEAWAYAGREAHALNEGQTAQTNAENCFSFAPFR